MISAVMPTYARADLAFERGEGSYLYDAQGRRYLDFAAGIAVVSLGHCHPHLVKTLQEQAGKLWHTSNLYRVPGQEKLAERLAANSFADMAFFTNSGVEAWEGAIKLARRYHYANGNPERWRVISCGGSFHGRTLAAISAAKSEKLTKGFGPLVEGFDQVAFGNLNELRAAITPETAAITVEPIQGEGGIRPASIEYLRGLRQVADEFGLLLVFDEIQTGFGRTGRLFAHEWADIAPDVMCVAKGLGGGFPVGAILATEKAAGGLTAGTHGTTFGGNPLAMAVANAVLDVMLEPGFLDGVERTGRLLWDRLSAVVRKHPTIVAEVRGKGLMLGLKCVVPNSALIERLQKHGMLAVGANDNVVRLLPPLTIGQAEVEEAVAILDSVCMELARETAAGGAG